MRGLLPRRSSGVHRGNVRQRFAARDEKRRLAPPHSTYHRPAKNTGSPDSLLTIEPYAKSSASPSPCTNSVKLPFTLGSRAATLDCVCAPAASVRFVRASSVPLGERAITAKVSLLLPPFTKPMF